VVLGTAVLAVPPTEAAGPGTPDRPGGVLPAPERFQLPDGPAHFTPAGEEKAGREAYLLQLSTRSTGRVYASTKMRGRAAVSARQLLARVTAALDRVVAALPARTSVLYRTHAVTTAVAVQTSSANYDELVQLPGVVRVLPIEPKSRDNSYAVDRQGAPSVWEGDASLGADVTIGIIDSGIDYTHANFGGAGTTTAYADERAHADESTVWAGSAFPTAKVIGGYDLAGNAYNASATTSDRFPQPDPNPLDCGGHGSHVAGSAAGLGVNADGSTYAGSYDTSTALEAMRIGPGMAPRAKLVAIKIFGCTGTTLLTSAGIDRAFDPNGDGSTADAVDVVNMSLGSDFGSPEDADAVVTDEAAALGMTMVVSAGNAFDLYDVGGSPGSARRAITVAASTDAQTISDGLHLTIGGTPQSVTTIRSVQYDWATGPDLLGEVVIPPTNTTGCAAFTGADAAAIAGKVALLHWTGSAAPECGSTVRADNVFAAGGAGYIVDIDQDEFQVLISGNSLLPGVMINDAAGNDLRAAIAGSQDVTATGTSFRDFRVVAPSDDDRIAEFSSRGIHGAGHLKPDVAAIGDTVFSTEVGTGSGGTTKNGTSMAAPMVAGLAALVVSAHPDWTPEQVKAGIMNTAGQDLDTNGSATAGGDRYGPNRVGAGRIQADPAIANDVLAYVEDDPGAVSVSFGPVEVTEPVTLTKTLTVQNTGSLTREYATSYDAITEVPGVDYVVSPATVTLDAGETASVTVSLETTDPTALTKTVDATKGRTSALPLEVLADASGNVLLTPTSGTAPELRVPVHAAPRPASQMTQPAALNVYGGGADMRLSGQDVRQGTAQERVSSLVTGLELQAVSPPAPTCAGAITSFCVRVPSDRGADIEYVGVTSDAPYYLDPSHGLVYFGIATHAAHAIPASRLEFDVYIDVDQDGDTDLIAASTRYRDINKIDYDTFVTLLMQPDGTVIDIQMTNNRLGDVDTAVFDSDVLMLPVSIGYLEVAGLDPASPRIDYGVASYSTRSVDLLGFTGAGTVDGSLSTNVYEPGVLVAGAGITGDAWGANTVYGPLLQDFDDTEVSVYVDEDSYAQDNGQGLLMLHFHNEVGNKAQVVTLYDAPPVVITPTATAALTVSPATVTRGTAVDLAVSVAGNVSVPTGAVSVKDAESGTVVASGALSNGAATLSFTPTTAGARDLVVAYAGDSTYAPAVSPAVTLTVDPAARDVMLSASPGSVVRGDTAILSVGVRTEPGDPVPTGTVTVLDGSGTSVASGDLGPDGYVLLPFSSLDPGRVRLHATWSGDANTVAARPSPTVRVRVTKAAPDVELSLSRQKGRVGKRVRTEVTVPVVHGVAATGVVMLKAGRRTLDTATLTDGAARLTFTPRKAGKLKLRVVYGGDPTYRAGKSDPSTYQVTRKKRR
jgi:subtilisin family serine protease